MREEKKQRYRQTDNLHWKYLGLSVAESLQGDILIYRCANHAIRFAAVRPGQAGENLSGRNVPKCRCLECFVSSRVALWVNMGNKYLDNISRNEMFSVIV